MSDLLSGLGAALAVLVNLVVITAVTRQLVGVPVGWLRTLLVAVVLTVGIGGTVSTVGRRLGFVDDQGSLVGDLDPALATVLVLLIIAWWLALGTGLLVLLEALVPSGSLPSPVAVLQKLPSRRRSTTRYAVLSAIAVRHGLGGFLRAGSGRHPVRDDDAPRVARSLRLAFTEAGVTFVKLGQMLATRPDLIGPAAARELGTLHADVPPEPWSAVSATLRAELGRPVEEVFAAVEQAPLAAASVGQVHRATLLDGSPVVLKVQRSSAPAQVAADLDIIRAMAARLERTTEWGRRLGVRGLADGFAESLTEELDYRVEAGNAEAVASSTGRSRGLVRVPAVHQELSTSRLLVMEEVRGAPLSRAGEALAALDDGRRRELAAALLATVLRQVLDVGTFHADLHAGNVMLEDGGTLALLDLGAVGRLDRTSREALGRLLLAVDRGDSLAATDALLEVLDAPAALDDTRLERELGRLLAQVKHLPVGAGASVFGDLFDLVVDHGMTVPPQMAAAFRALGALEGTLRTLDPGSDLVRDARAAGSELLTERLAPAQLKASAEDYLAQVLPLLQRLPRRLDKVGRSLQRGELSVGVRLLAHPDERAFVAGLVHLSVMAVLAAALTLGAVILLVAPGSPPLAEGVALFTVLGAVLLLFAFVLGARVLAVIFRAGRD